MQSCKWPIKEEREFSRKHRKNSELGSLTCTRLKNKWNSYKENFPITGLINHQERLSVLIQLQSTHDNSNLQGKSKKSQLSGVQVIGRLDFRRLPGPVFDPPRKETAGRVTRWPCLWCNWKIDNLGVSDVTGSETGLQVSYLFGSKLHQALPYPPKWLSK